jgi:hypothetical protein
LSGRLEIHRVSSGGNAVISTTFTTKGTVTLLLVATVLAEGIGWRRVLAHANMRVN